MLLPQVTEDGDAIYQDGGIYGRNRFDSYERFSPILSEMSVKYLGGVIE